MNDVFDLGNSAPDWDAENRSARSAVDIGGWLYDWSEYATSAEPVKGWSHHGVVVGPGGEGLVVASPDGHALVRLRGGRGSRTADLPVTECHGMSVDAFGSAYAIWIADNGTKFDHRERGEHLDIDRPGQVVRVDVSGRVQQVIDDRGLDDGSRGWRPTGVTSESEKDGGRIWVADGYGRSRVHCFSREGEPLWTTDGGDSGLALASPHAIILDTRRPVPELLVADRNNRRIVVLDTDGRFLRAYGEGELTSPSGFAFDGDWVWVTELHGAIVAFGSDETVAARLGDTDGVDAPGWPNTIVGEEVERSALTPGVFRSPHGIAVDDAGTIAISEWVIGGRVIVLTPR
ncbi:MULTISPECIES: hypothetical protein [unclassified Microbacterium]|uniref:hypothetical protein n=1 Tax=unclassified Microbacterium TaxID=2609290 RepID=UPI00109D46EC|nr:MULTISPECIES: hypothetical protein [unclassified Microbacterium]